MTDVTKWVGADVESAIGPTLDAFTAAAEPALRNCAEVVYEELLYAVQDYLRSNAQWNLGAEIDRCRKIEVENRELRAAMREVVEALEAMLTASQPQAVHRVYIGEAQDMADAALAKAKAVML